MDTFTQIEPANVERIAVLRALFLGDLLCATPALRALEQAFPRAEVTLIGLPWAATLVERLPYLDRFVAFPGYPGVREVAYDQERTTAFFADMRAQRFDLAFQMHGDGRSTNGFLAQLGAARTIGYARPGDTRLDIRTLYAPEEHETLRWLRLVHLAGGSASEPWPLNPEPSPAARLEFPTTPAEQQRAVAMLAVVGADRPLVGLHPGSKDAARRWPAVRFAALGDQLAARYNAQIVLTGGAEERAITQAVQAHMRAPALDLAGATDLGSFAAVIAQLDLLVSNDTGAAHFAAAAKTPSVVLFGPSRPQQWAALDHMRHTAVDARMLTPHADDGTAALAQLDLAPVLAACEAMLATKARAVSV